MSASNNNNKPSSNGSSSDPPPSTPSADEIEARLSKLRAETNGVVQQRDLEERLAKLTNRAPNYYSSSEPPIKIYQMISKERAMTDDQRADHMMEQLFAEMALDAERGKSGQQIDEEIARRLAILREQTQSLNLSSNQQRQHFDLNQRPKGHRELIEEILSRPDHEDHHQKMNISDDEDDNVQHDDNHDESLDWCTTCNEDASLRCVDCEDDLYCHECFRELHRDSDMRRHRTVPYQKSSSNSATSKASSKGSSRSKKRNS